MAIKLFTAHRQLWRKKFNKEGRVYRQERFLEKLRKGWASCINQLYGKPRPLFIQGGGIGWNQRTKNLSFPDGYKAGETARERKGKQHAADL